MILTTSDVQDAIKSDLAALSEARLSHGVVRVTTHVLYPSNGLVRVSLRTHFDRVIVSDDGGGINEARSAGAEISNPSRALRPVVDPYGLFLDGGVICSMPTSLQNALGTVVLVSNASREVSEWVHRHARLKPGRDFRQLLADLLLRRYEGSVSQHAKVLGASNKPHIFPHMLKMNNGKNLLLDPVINDSSSINARVVVNLDVRSIGNSQLEQRIIYDDYEKWDPANLNLLEVGAKVVPFSRLEGVIERLTA